MSSVPQAESKTILPLPERENEVKIEHVVTYAEYRHRLRGRAPDQRDRCHSHRRPLIPWSGGKMEPEYLRYGNLEDFFSRQVSDGPNYSQVFFRETCQASDGIRRFVGQEGTRRENFASCSDVINLLGRRIANGLEKIREGFVPYYDYELELKLRPCSEMQNELCEIRVLEYKTIHFDHMGERISPYDNGLRFSKWVDLFAKEFKRLRSFRFPNSEVLFRLLRTIVHDS